MRKSIMRDLSIATFLTLMGIYFLLDVKINFDVENKDNIGTTIGFVITMVFALYLHYSNKDKDKED